MAQIYAISMSNLQVFKTPLSLSLSLSLSLYIYIYIYIYIYVSFKLQFNAKKKNIDIITCDVGNENITYVYASKDSKITSK